MALDPRRAQYCPSGLTLFDLIPAELAASLSSQSEQSGLQSEPI